MNFFLNVEAKNKEKLLSWKENLPSIAFPYIYIWVMPWLSEEMTPLSPAFQNGPNQAIINNLFLVLREISFLNFKYKICSFLTFRLFINHLQNESRKISLKHIEYLEQKIIWQSGSQMLAKLKAWLVFLFFPRNNTATQYFTTVVFCLFINPRFINCYENSFINFSMVSIMKSFF